ncbi:SLAM family member 9-like isoform X4 [Trachinotus anak]|uniref:SLAM family member 9-like isoform X4 n=1 Tax=Trachinotus anak TaxID=443729 RepID=UPI0039F17CFD
MMCFFVIVGLLVCIEAPGSSALTPVFVQEGTDLLLEIMEADVPENFFILSWRFNRKDVLVRFVRGREPRVSTVYSGRLEPFVKNFSVKLKNLQESDSGVYSAQVTGVQVQNLAEYKVTVQDPVSPVELTVDSVSSSSDSCNLTVTCSTRDSHHINISSTFTCDTKTCSQEGGERSKVTTSGASLRVYLVNHLIICNYSNQVSWEKDNKMTEHFCEGQRGSESLSDGVSLCLLKTVVFSVGLIIMVSAVISVHLLERLKKQK